MIVRGRRISELKNPISSFPRVVLLEAFRLISIFGTKMDGMCSYWAGREALLALALLEGAWGEEALEDVSQPYGLGLDAMDASQLISLIHQAKDLLAGRILEGNGPVGPSLVITRDYRIFIGGRRGREIRMRPMSKAVFLLFLRHPEGIGFQDIGQYRRELEALYRRICRWESREEVERCLDRVLNAASREVNIAASRASEALSGLLEAEVLPAYVIAGERGGPKRIRLDRRLVVWL